MKLLRIHGQDWQPCAALGLFGGCCQLMTCLVVWLSELYCDDRATAIVTSAWIGRWLWQPDRLNREKGPSGNVSMAHQAC